VSIKPTWLF